MHRLAGQTAAVDVSCWLHRGLFASAHKLARGEATDAHFHFIMKHVRLLQDNRVRCILVFDGANLPMKAAVNGQRGEKRREARAKADVARAEGRLNDAARLLQNNTEVTWEIVKDVIEVRRKLWFLNHIAAPPPHAQHRRDRGAVRVGRATGVSVRERTGRLCRDGGFRSDRVRR